MFVVYEYKYDGEGAVEGIKIVKMTRKAEDVLPLVLEGTALVTTGVL
ncbi:hypothetical protein HC928_00475 [bacterium]|nr:hypothetical protein [bacterium]